MVSLYEKPDYWTIHGYLSCKCWDGGCGIDRLLENGVNYFLAEEGDGIQISKEGIDVDDSEGSILIVWEPSIVSPNTYEYVRNKSWYGKLFTSVQDDGYHIITPNPLRYDSLHLSSKEKFACMVTSNKTRGPGKGLYYLRQEIIDVGKGYEGFDLYGMGWSDECACYKGEIPWDRSTQPELWRPKVEKMSEYKFTFVVENSEIIGYVTEKIINALVAGCIPVYFGAPDIDKYVPSSCFIDGKKLGIVNSFEYISSMGEDDLLGYYKNIKDFISSSDSYYLSSYYLADQILKILKDKGDI